MKKSNTALGLSRFNRRNLDSEISQARSELFELFVEFEKITFFCSSLFENPDAQSEIPSDDRALGPYLMTTEVQWAINSANDHIHALRNLVIQNLIPDIASYTFIRAALEHASLVIWYLDDDDSSVRRRRVLVQAFNNLKLTSRAMADLGNSDEVNFKNRTEKVELKIAELSQDPLSSQERRGMGFKGIVDFAGKRLQEQGFGPDGTNIVSSVWQLTSGVAHSNTTSGLMLLGRDAKYENLETRSTVFQMLTTEVELLRLLSVCFKVLNSAVELISFRHGRRTTKYSRFSVDSI